MATQIYYRVFLNGKTEFFRLTRYFDDDPLDEKCYFRYWKDCTPRWYSEHITDVYSLEILNLQQWTKHKGNVPRCIRGVRYVVSENFITWKAKLGIKQSFAHFLRDFYFEGHYTPKVIPLSEDEVNNLNNLLDL